MLRLQFAHNGGLVAEDIHDFDRDSLVAAHWKRLRFELKLELLWVDLKTQGL